jgi:hypothetical protein
MTRPNKHNANRHEAVVGGQRCKFDSMAEHRYAEWLEKRRKAKFIGKWEHHPKAIKVWDEVSGDELVRLNVDFRVETPTGVEWHEVKGMATAVWRLKRRILETLTLHIYVVIDAGRGVCATGKGEPAMFDERPRRKRKARE